MIQLSSRGKGDGTNAHAVYLLAKLSLRMEVLAESISDGSACGMIYVW